MKEVNDCKNLRAAPEWGGWNVASRFGYDPWVVGGKAKGERNVAAGWTERNGIKEALLRG